MNLKSRHKIIEDVIKKNSHWEGMTVSNFRSQVRRYFEKLGIPEKEFNNYFNNGRNYKEDIETIWKSLVKKSPGTRNNYIFAVKTLLEHYNIDFGLNTIEYQNYWKNLRKQAKGKRPFTMDKVPTTEELKQLLLHTNIRGKALFLLCATSGLRIDEALSITWDNIDMTGKIPVISIPAAISKTNEARITFCTTEAKQLLNEWKKERPRYMKEVRARYNLRNDYKIDIDDPRIFPFVYSGALRLWHQMINRAGKKYLEKDKSTREGKGRYKYHIHALRKYVKTRLSLAGVPNAIRDWIVGHEGSRPEYDRPTIEELIPEYMKAHDSMLIFEAQPDLSGVQAELKEKDERIEKLERDIADMDRQLRKLLIDRLQEQDKNKN